MPNDFWIDKVEPAFNDTMVRPHFNFPSYCSQDMDLSFHRDEWTGMQLLAAFERFQKTFNIVLNACHRSHLNLVIFRVPEIPGQTSLQSTPKHC